MVFQYVWKTINSTLPLTISHFLSIFLRRRRLVSLSRFVILAHVKWFPDVRQSATKSSASLQRSEAERSKERSKTLQFAKGLSCVDSISKIHVSKWTKKSARRFLTRSREVAENLICIRSLTDPVSRFVQIYCSDHFPSPLSKSPARCGFFFPNSRFALSSEEREPDARDGHLSPMKLNWSLCCIVKEPLILFLQLFIPSKIKSRILLTRKISFFHSNKFPLFT